MYIYVIWIYAVSSVFHVSQLDYKEAKLVLFFKKRTPYYLVVQYYHILHQCLKFMGDNGNISECTLIN